MAKAEIERILSCDESARATINKTQKEAGELMAGIEKRLAIIRQQAQEEIQAFRQNELSKILEDASIKASKVEKETKNYCQRLQKIWLSQREEVASEFLKLFYKEAGIY